MAARDKRSVKRLYFDPRQCSGCLSCVVFCSQRRTGSSGPSCAGLRVALEAAQGDNAALFCLQCERAHCAEACVRGAIHRVEGGWWEIDYAICDGCGLCVEACSTGRMFVSPVDKLPIKCDLCGGQPLCITVCGTGALTYESPAERATRSERKNDN
jgi:anaerobic carbon-monoxide dehydrogenase iron sulfur subunit